MSSTLAGNYGDYIPCAGHPLVRVCVYNSSGTRVQYVGDREPLLALGFIPEERLTWPRQKKTGKGSRPRSSRYVGIDAYWRSENGQPVRRFRVLVLTTPADALSLPGVREVLQAAEQRAEEERREKEAALHSRSPALARYLAEYERESRRFTARTELRLVVDNTREEP
jgi:hypothetical protein